MAFDETPTDTTGEGTPAGGEPAPSGGEPTPSGGGGESYSSGGEPTPSGGGSEMISVDDFGWDDWGGDAYDSFPEQVRPWVEKAGEYFNGRISSKEKELLHTKALYDAFTNGYEDPRIAELNEKVQTFEQERALLEQKLANFEAQREKEYEEQDAQYLKWYEQNYAEKQARFRDAYDNPKDVMFSLLDAGYELHIATEIGLFGEKAVKDAIELGSKLNDTELALEILSSRYKMDASSGTPGRQQMPAAPKQEKPKPRVSPSDDMVAGSTRATTPKPVGNERPKYGRTGNAQRDRLLAIVNKHV